MQEVFEKIIEKLKEISIFMTTCDGYGANCVSVGTIEEIVKQEAEKYNNGWIPCSERLPKIRQDCLVTVRYKGFMGMHGIWVKTGHMEAENDWWGDCSGGEVIAWQPLPEPYQPKGE